MDAEFIKFIGKDNYVALLKKYNLCTKKWTYGKIKGFYTELNKLYKKKLRELEKKDEQ